MSKRVVGLVSVVSLGVLLGACAAPVGDEESGSTSEAIIRPNGMCHYVSGHTGLVPTTLVGPTSLASYPGSSPQDPVVQFEDAAWAAGATQTWWMRAEGTSAAWLGLDVTKVWTQQSLVSTWQNVNPVYASLYECTWNWGDYYLPPGQTRPYMPTSIMVFDPNCTSSNCKISGGHI